MGLLEASVLPKVRLPDVFLQNLYNLYNLYKLMML